MSDQPDRSLISEQFDAVQIMLKEGEDDTYEAGVHDALGWVLGHFDAPIELVDSGEEEPEDDEEDDEEDGEEE